MDFKGQFYCERFFQILVVLFGIVGFGVGYVQQDFRLTFYFLATGGGISAVVRASRLSTIHTHALPEARRHVCQSQALNARCRGPGGRSAYPIGLGGTGTR